jgi:hypothetical protein
LKELLGTNTGRIGRIDSSVGIGWEFFVLNIIRDINVYKPFSIYVTADNSHSIRKIFWDPNLHDCRKFRT